MDIKYFNELAETGITALKWSNPEPPPPVGQRIRITINGIGEATVARYFTQQGYLGVVATVDKWPDHFQDTKGMDCHCFGAEISY